MSVKTQFWLLCSVKELTDGNAANLFDVAVIMSFLFNEKRCIHHRSGFDVDKVPRSGAISIVAHSDTPATRL
jgi:hypothetical protein